MTEIVVRKLILSDDEINRRRIKPDVNSSIDSLFIPVDVIFVNGSDSRTGGGSVA